MLVDNKLTGINFQYRFKSTLIEIEVFLLRLKGLLCLQNALIRSIIADLMSVCYSKL